MTNEKELKPCKVKKLLNDEVVTGIFPKTGFARSSANPDGSFTDIASLDTPLGEVVGTPEYEKPDDDKVGTKPVESLGDKVIYVKDTPEEEFVPKALAVYKRMWGSDWIYYQVGCVDSHGSIVLDIPRQQEISSYYDPLDKDKYKEELARKGYPLSVQKFSPIWYRDSDLTDKRMIVSFVPSNDVYEIINFNKNESIGYVSHEGNVIYWNQYRS